MAFAFAAAEDLTPRRAEALLAGPDTLFFHARGKLAASLAAGKFKLLAAFAAHAAAAGWGVRILQYSAASRAMVEAGGHLHVLMEDHPLYAPNCFHAVPSYLRGYWYFDEVASRNNSSHRLRPFDPRPMSEAFGNRFQAKLLEQFAGKNFSKFSQAGRGGEAIAPGCIVYFAQDFLPPRFHKHYMSVTGMIDAGLAARGARAFHIKPHPNQSPAELATLKAYHRPEAGVFVTNASIHDLLAACDLVLTLTSAVGFEGFIHGKPLVLGGQTDFGQNAVTLTDPARMADAMAEALARDWPHGRFLVWYLKRNCLEDSPRALPALLERVHAKGYAFADAEGRGFY